MMTVLLVIHLMVAAALVFVVLLQKSEGGALGIGGGGGGSSFLTGRGQANFLTRVTASLALAFFITSLSMTFLSRSTAPQGSILDAPAAATTPVDGSAIAPGSAPAPTDAPAETPKGGILDKLK